jgi:citrate lyase beta subunit
MEFYARCLLFTPANKPERFEKAKELGADGVIIDLEDAIALEGKDEAREIVINHLKSMQHDKNFLQCVRINSLRTAAGLKDILALKDSGHMPDLIMLPKTESAHEIQILNELLSPNNVPLIPLIETAKGLFNAAEIAREQQVTALLFGGADFSADLGAKLEWAPMESFRAQLSMAAAQAGVAVIDVPYLHLNDFDDSGVITETEKVKAMGYTCKTSIHPKHIAPILSVFNPSEEEVARAKRIVAAFDAAKGNACQIDGKMIDIPVVRSAQRILKLAKQ